VSRVLVDSNVLLDVFSEDPTWFDWSSDQLADLAERSILVVNPIVYAEVSIQFDRVEDLEEALGDQFEREALPWEAAFVAGKSYLSYRRRGGERRSPLPDFYIGGHAAVRGMILLTRDPSRYRTYFPKLEIIAP
jgi:predicted nucleic acid-binding protein